MHCWGGVTQRIPALPFLVLASVLAASCGGATAAIAPSVVQTQTAAPTTTSVPRWTISGVVRDHDEGFGVGNVSVRLVDRFEPRSTTTDAAGRYVFREVAQSGVGMVFSSEGYRDLTIEQVLPNKDLTIDVAITRECASRPGLATLSFSLSGPNVIFTWPAVESAQEYELSVGRWDYVSPVFAVTTAGTSYTWTDAPPGTYHARVRARNGCGYGNAANELKVVVP